MASLLEMMLESALTDIKEAPPGGLANLSQQALWLLRLLQDFLCAEGHGNQELWSEKVRLFGGVEATHILRPYNLRVSSLGDGRVHRAVLDTSALVSISLFSQAKRSMDGSVGVGLGIPYSE